MPLLSFQRDDPYLTSRVPESDPDELADLGERAEQWTERLSTELDARSRSVRVLRGYYDGHQPIRFATKKWRQTFGSDFGQVVDNWTRIVIDSATERMTLQGFRASGASDQQVDGRALETWRRSRLDVDSDVAHTDALVTGYSYVLVSRDQRTGEARITVEDPLQTIVEFDPADRRHRRAALKRWRELDGTWHALLMTPEWTWTLRGARDTAAPGSDWQHVARERNPLGVVTVIPLVNVPDIYMEGRSDLDPMLPMQDAANKLLGDMMIASEFAAYRQRVLIGEEIPTDPVTGEPDRKIMTGVTRLLALENPDAKIQELSAADLSNYIGAIDMLVQQISAVSKVPPHYLLGQIANVSGDALAAAESGLVSRVKRRCRLFGEPWAEAVELAMRIDDPGRAPVALEALWANPERVSDAQRGDYAVKLFTIGFPFEAIARELGVPPDEIAGLVAGRERDAVVQGLGFGLSPNGAPVEPPPAPSGVVES